MLRHYIFLVIVLFMKTVLSDHETTYTDMTTELITHIFICKDKIEQNSDPISFSSCLHEFINSKSLPSNCEGLVLCVLKKTNLMNVNGTWNKEEFVKVATAYKKHFANYTKEYRDKIEPHCFNEPTTEIELFYATAKCALNRSEMLNSYMHKLESEMAF